MVQLKLKSKIKPEANVRILASGEGRLKSIYYWDRSRPKF